MLIAKLGHSGVNQRSFRVWSGMFVVYISHANTHFLIGVGSIWDRTGNKFGRFCTPGKRVKGVVVGGGGGVVVVVGGGVGVVVVYHWGGEGGVGGYCGPWRLDHLSPHRTPFN